jgi:hypothetical protein
MWGAEEWTCHVCGKSRPDNKISVHSTTIIKNDIPITQNVRYCNDNPDCIEGAKTIDWINK